MNRSCLFWIFLIVLTGFLAGCSNPSAKKAKHFERGQSYLKSGELREAVIEFKNVLQIDARDVQGHYQLAQAYLRLGGTVNLQAAYKELKEALQLAPSLSEARLKLGGLYLLTREYDKAEAEARTILQNQSNHADAQLLLAESLAGKGKLTEAIEAAKKTLEWDPKQIRPYLVLAMLYELTKNVPAAEETYQQALAQDPGSVETHLRLAEFYLRSGRPKESETTYLKAVALDQSNVGLHFQLANFYIAIKDIQKAEARFVKATEIDPKAEEPFLVLGDFYRSQGRSEQALQAYQKALGSHPDSLPTQRKLAEAALDDNDLNAAEKWIANILSARSNDLNGRFLKGRLYLAKRQYKEAVTELQWVTREEPAYAQAYYYLGLARLGNREVQLAKVSLTEAVKLAPRFTEALFALAEVELKTGSYALAIEAAEKVVEAKPNNVKARLVLGEAYARDKQLNKALEEFKTVIRLAPKEPKGYYFTGLVYRAQRKESDALKAFEQALDLNPSDVDALAQIAFIYIAKKEGQKAVDRCLTQLQKVPGDAKIHGLLGRVYRLLGKTDLAEASFKKAIELDNNLLIAYMDLGSLYTITKQYEKAQEGYEAALRLNPEQASAYVMLGIIHDQKTQYAKGNEYYEKALKIDKRFAPAANNLAWNYSEHGGNIDVALSLAEQARELLPEDPYVADTLGWIYFKKNVYLKAISLLKESTEKLGENPIVRYHLGMAYYKNGDKDQAKKALEASLKISKSYPGAEEAEKTLKELTAIGPKTSPK